MVPTFRSCIDVAEGSRLPRFGVAHSSVCPTGTGAKSSCNITPPSSFRNNFACGIHVSSFSWTYLPGLQFILAGLAGNTASFFAVPAMRLALDVLVYIGVIAVFMTKVSLSSKTRAAERYNKSITDSYKRRFRTLLIGHGKL